MNKSAQKTSITCQVCHKVKTASYDSMKTHLNFHPHIQCIGKVNICYLCDEKFDLQDPQYQEHKDGHMTHMKQDANNQCVACYKKFSKQDQLFTHVYNVHEVEKVYPCAKCNEKFDRKKKFSLHLDTIHNN